MGSTRRCERRVWFRGQTTSEPSIHNIPILYGLRNCSGSQKRHFQRMKKTMFTRWRGWLCIPLHESIYVCGVMKVPIEFPRFPISFFFFFFFKCNLCNLNNGLRIIRGWRWRMSPRPTWKRVMSIMKRGPKPTSVICLDPNLNDDLPWDFFIISSKILGHACQCHCCMMSIL